MRKSWKNGFFFIDLYMPVIMCGIIGERNSCEETKYVLHTRCEKASRSEERFC